MPPHWHRRWSSLNPILKALSASSLVIGFGSDGWARIGRPKTREHLHYKDTLFFVLHKESERRIRPRVCAQHVVVQMRGPQRPRTAWSLPDLAGYGPFEVQPRMEDRVGSKCGPRRRRGSLLFLVRLAASDRLWGYGMEHVVGSNPTRSTKPPIKQIQRPPAFLPQPLFRLRQILPPCRQPWRIRLHLWLQYRQARPQLPFRLPVLLPPHQHPPQFQPRDPRVRVLLS